MIISIAAEHDEGKFNSIDISNDQLEGDSHVCIEIGDREMYVGINELFHAVRAFMELRTMRVEEESKRK